MRTELSTMMSGTARATEICHVCGMTSFRASLSPPDITTARSGRPSQTPCCNQGCSCMAAVTKAEVRCGTFGTLGRGWSLLCLSQRARLGNGVTRPLWTLRSIAAWRCCIRVCQDDRWGQAATNATTPAKRQFHSANWDRRTSQRMWIFGGSGESTIFSDLWYFQIVAPAPEPGVVSPGYGAYSGVSTGSDPGSFGYGGEPAELNASYSYSWTKMSPLGLKPSARHSHVSAIDYSNVLWVQGGTDGATVFRDLWQYNIQANRWFEGPDGPARSAAAGTFFYSFFVITGGRRGGQTSDSAWLLETSQVSTPPVDAFTVISGNCVVVGGCVQSPNFPEPYDNNASCTIVAHEGMSVYATHFNTELDKDNLTINGDLYSGMWGPEDVIISGSEIEWQSDDTQAGSGWRLCGREFTVNTGPCTLLGGCVRSPQFPAEYGFDSCTITPRPGIRMHIPSLSVRDSTLTVNGNGYNQWSQRPSTVVADYTQILWTPGFDSFHTGELFTGFELCSAAFEVVSGPCEATEHCVHSKNFPSQYGVNESCIIHARDDTPIRSWAFDLAAGDSLIINGVSYTGGDVVPVGDIIWSSHGPDVGTGWLLCDYPFTVEGPCIVEDDNDCVTSPNFPGQYGTSESCSILARPGMRVAATTFKTEELYDQLEITDIQYSGRNAPQNVTPRGPMEWLSNAQTVDDGWRLCKVCDQDEETSGCLCELGFERKGARCQLCKTGQFRSNYSQTSCSDCPAGKYTLMRGAVTCSDCPPGFSSTPGSTGCDVCPAGTYAEVWADPECHLCPQGYFSSSIAANNFDTCQPCSPGSITVADGATSEQECLSFDPGQERFCSAGKVCTITDLTGSALLNNSLMLITSEFPCDAPKLAVTGILNQGVSNPSGMEGTSFQWGQSSEDFVPAGDIYHLCFCANLVEEPCADINQFLLSAGTLRVRGPSQQDASYECTRGSTCNGIEIFGYDLQESDRVALHRGGCGSADATQHAATSYRARQLGDDLSSLTLGFGRILFDPEDVGYSVCWCAVVEQGDCQNIGDFNVAAGKLRLMGAYGGQEKSCAVGQDCALENVAGVGLIPGDRLMILSACGTGSALPGFPSNGTLETENGQDFDFLGEARWLTSLPGIYRICYCRPRADDPTKEVDPCKVPTSFKAAVGLMTVNGPLQTTTTCALGSSCEVTIQGIDLAAGDAIMIVDGPCGEGGGLEALGFPDLETSVTLQSGDSGYLANLGNIPTAASPGVYTICWCPLASSCRARSAFRATAGELHVTCPPGYYGVGPTTGRRCGLCTRGFHCAGGEVNVATRIACGPDQTTRISGATGAEACVCVAGYKYDPDTQQCVGCAIGEYKPEEGDDEECLPCRENTTTYQRGSTSNSSCVDPNLLQNNDNVSGQESSLVPAVAFSIALENLPSSDAVWSDLNALLRSAVSDVGGVSASAVDIELVNASNSSGRRLAVTGLLAIVTIRHRTEAEATRMLESFDVEALTGELQADVEDQAATFGSLSFVVASPLEQTAAPVRCPESKAIPPGVAVLSAEECRCGPGFGYDALLQQCSPCSKGFYKASIGDDLCTQCPEFTSTGDEGSASQSDCICEAGLFTDGTGACQVCPDNFFCEKDGKAEPCRPNSETASPGARIPTDCMCSAGYTTEVINETEACTPCARGLYKPNIGNGICSLSCPANADSEPGASSRADCFCTPQHHAELDSCVFCNYRGLECPGGFNANGSHVQPRAEPGFFQTGSTLAVKCEVNQDNGDSACLGGADASGQGDSFGNVCAEGSRGFLCGECPGGFSRDKYPKNCGVCPDDSTVGATLVILLDLGQNIILNFIVATLAAMSAVQASHSLHTSMIRISTQWMTACSVITHFSIDQLPVFSWTEENLQLQSSCFGEDNCDETVQTFTYPWPQQVTNWIQQVFELLDFKSKLTSVSFMVQCKAEQLFPNDDVVKLAAPGLYFVLSPILAMLGIFLISSVVVYVFVPLARRRGVEFTEAAKKQKQREEVMEVLEESLESPLQAMGLTFADVKASGVLADAPLPWLLTGVEEPKDFAEGLLERSGFLKVKKGLLEVRDGICMESLLSGTDLTWEDCMAEALALSNGLERCGRLAEESTEESNAPTNELTNARGSPDLLETFVLRCLVQRRVAPAAAESNVDKSEVAMEVADYFSSIEMFAKVDDANLQTLVTSTCARLRQQQGEDKVAVQITKEPTVDMQTKAEASAQLDLDHLDFGLFTSFPSPRMLFHQCTPVIWVTLINMWPTLLSHYLQMIWCKPVPQQDGVKQRLLPHPDLQCWQGDHWPLAILALVGLSCWCIGIPLLLYLVIWRLDDRNSPANHRRYGFFIDGFEPQYWWWDIVVKRGDIAIMLLLTYTSVADDDKAKLLLYPIISGIVMALCSWCKPFLNDQAEILDSFEFGLSIFRFIFFGTVAVVLISNPSVTVTFVLAGWLAVVLTCVCVYLGMHVIAQFLRNVSREIDAEEETNAQEVQFNERLNQRISSKSFNEKGVVKAAGQVRRTMAAVSQKAESCSDRVKQFMVRYMLPLFQETEEERYLLEWRLKAEAVELLSSQGRKRKSGKVSFWKRARARLLRFGGFFQRRIVRQALDEFSMLWLEIFEQGMLPKNSLEVLCALTAANVRVPFKMPKKDIPQRWEEEVRRLLEDGEEATHRFSPDAVMSATQRLGSLPADAAVGLVKAVCQTLRAVEKKEEGSASFSDFGAPPAAPEVADGSLSMSPLSTAAPGDIDSEDVFVEGSHCSV